LEEGGGREEEHVLMRGRRVKCLSSNITPVILLN